MSHAFFSLLFFQPNSLRRKSIGNKEIPAGTFWSIGAFGTGLFTVRAGPSRWADAGASCGFAGRLVVSTVAVKGAIFTVVAFFACCKECSGKAFSIYTDRQLFRRWNFGFDRFITRIPSSVYFLIVRNVHHLDYQRLSVRDLSS